METTFISIIQSKLKLPNKGVSNTVKLLSEGATIPFIARYRKEMTGSLDELALSDIKKELQGLEELVKRKESILKSIKEQDKLTSALEKKISNCWDSTILEDLYLPFKRKVKTRASVAREQGLEPLADMICSKYNMDLFGEAKKYLTADLKEVKLVLDGARDIIAEWVNEDPKVRELMRFQFSRHAWIESKVVKKMKEEAKKYETYFNYSEKLDKIPSHRLLAIFRGENEGFLKSKIAIESDYAQRGIERIYVNTHKGPAATQIRMAIEDSLKRLLLPSIENEFKKTSKGKADVEAIGVFTRNLKDLLLAAPLGNKSILGLDPGFRSGCKLVVLDQQGDLVHDTTIYPHPPQNKDDEARYTVEGLVEKYKVEAIAIGNGTAGKETFKWINSFTQDTNLEVFFVNESGASIYSASKLARDEFPDKDITVRGAVSIGRRLMDPLAELVKLDPKSIGVGQYQHDVNQTLLKNSLEETVASCVNAVGVNINTASQHLLAQVSGLGPVLADNIVKFRSEEGPLNNRKQLLKVPRMGKKAFEQSAGFLRIKEGENPLDDTAVHPESYAIVKAMAKDLGVKLNELIENKDLHSKIVLQNYVNDKVGIPSLQDILKELAKPGLDPRGEAKAVTFSNNINTLSDLSIGMILPGVVNNVTKFGAFVDIGIKESGLVHVSEITNRFIKDPAEILSVNQEVQVKVIKIDEEKSRVSLSIKQV